MTCESEAEDAAAGREKERVEDEVRVFDLLCGCWSAGFRRHSLCQWNRSFPFACLQNLQGEDGFLSLAAGTFVCAAAADAMGCCTG